MPDDEKEVSTAGDPGDQKPAVAVVDVELVPSEPSVNDRLSELQAQIAAIREQIASLSAENQEDSDDAPEENTDDGPSGDDSGAEPSGEPDTGSDSGGTQETERAPEVVHWLFRKRFRRS